jgi:hypothetical protein
MAVSRSSALPLLTAALAVWAGAQARQSATPPAPAASAVPASTTQKAVVDKATAASSVAAKRAAAAAAQLIRDARNAGFTAQNIDGVQMFCRLDTEIGSRFLVRTCYDELQVRIKIGQYQTERNELEAIHHLQ